MFDKEHILAEIKRTAAANHGVPLGVQRFRAETGVRSTDWRGKYWVRWGDALREAGFAANQLQSAYETDYLLEKLALLSRELGQLPVHAELQFKHRADETFPAGNTFARLGNKAERADKLRTFCVNHAEFSDVASMCDVVLSAPSKQGRPSPSETAEVGYVYLVRSGRFYKIGRSNSAGRRARELAIQLPERSTLVHSVKTDDPVGIEGYWHRRFADRRKNGEWFELSAADVSAFRRRNFM